MRKLLDGEKLLASVGRRLVKKAVLGCVIAMAGSLALTVSSDASIIYEGVTTATGTNTGTGQVAGATTFDVGGDTLANRNAITNAITSVGGYTQLGSNLKFQGTGQVLIGTSVIGAEPFLDTTQYLSVLGNGSVTVTLSAPANQISFYWGSIDSWNTITFRDGITTQSFTGASITPKFDNGCQQDKNCNGLVTFQDLSRSFTSFTMTSSKNSFETDNFLASQVQLSRPVPEASTWVMMILGFFSVGLVGYRRSGLSLRLV
jgi:hypothetical protein